MRKSLLSISDYITIILHYLIIMRLNPFIGQFSQKSIDIMLFRSLSYNCYSNPYIKSHFDRTVIFLSTDDRRKSRGQDSLIRHSRHGEEQVMSGRQVMRLWLRRICFIMTVTPYTKACPVFYFQLLYSSVFHFLFFVFVFQVGGSSNLSQSQLFLCDFFRYSRSSCLSCSFLKMIVPPIRKLPPFSMTLDFEIIYVEFYFFLFLCKLGRAFYAIYTSGYNQENCFKSPYAKLELELLFHIFHAIYFKKAVFTALLFIEFFFFNYIFLLSFNK